MGNSQFNFAFEILYLCNCSAKLMWIDIFVTDAIWIALMYSIVWSVIAISHWLSQKTRGQTFAEISHKWNN